MKDIIRIVERAQTLEAIALTANAEKTHMIVMRKDTNDLVITAHTIIARVIAGAAEADRAMMLTKGRVVGGGLGHPGGLDHAPRSRGREIIRDIALAREADREP